jgi:hypothetical protein
MEIQFSKLIFLFFEDQEMPKKMITFLTDASTERGPWLSALHDGGPTNITSALATEWDDWSIIISTKKDTWKEFLKTAEVASLEKQEVLQADGSEVTHTLVFAPSHGVDDGAALQWLPKVGTKKSYPANFEEWMNTKVHAHDLPVGVAIEMAFMLKCSSLHFHCCNVAMHLKTYEKQHIIKNPKTLRVTGFNNILWESYNANLADKWLRGGLQQRAKEDGKYLIPRGDGWLFRFSFVGSALALAQTPRLLGAQGGKRGRE